MVTRLTDFTLWLYGIAIILLVFNLTIFIVWNFESRAYKDRRFRPVCFHMLGLICAFIYMFSINFWVRLYRYTDHARYDEILGSSLWAWKTLPVIGLLLWSSIKLGRWFYLSMRLKYHCKKGIKSNQRKE